MTDEEQQSPHRNSEDSPAIGQKWLIETDFDRTGVWQMNRDEELARARITDPALPNVLRLYSWSPSAVSIGFQQKIESIDPKACQEAGVDVVRRPTGGRAVLHANELTYAVVMRSAPSDGIYAVHNAIVNSLLRSLEGLGPAFQKLNLTGREADRNFSETYKTGTLTNAACFASSARHEVTVDGRKVIGSAQRRFGEVVLQHGSILLTNDHLALPNYLALSMADRVRMLALLQHETSTLSDIFERPISIEECANSIRDRFVSHICEVELHSPAKIQAV